MFFSLLHYHLSKLESNLLPSKLNILSLCLLCFAALVYLISEKISWAWECPDLSICILACRHLLIILTQGVYMMGERLAFDLTVFDLLGHSKSKEIYIIMPEIFPRCRSQMYNIINRQDMQEEISFTHEYITISGSCVVFIWTIPICNLIMQTSYYNASCSFWGSCSQSNILYVLICIACNEADSVSVCGHSVICNDVFTKMYNVKYVVGLSSFLLSVILVTSQVVYQGFQPPLAQSLLSNLSHSSASMLVLINTV